MTEKKIENSILDYLDMLPGAVFWKVDVTGVYDSARKVFRRRTNKHRYKGVPDIIGFYKGYFIAIEVKTHKRRNQVTPEQEEFILTANNNGQIAFIATSAKEVADKMAIVGYDK